MWSGPTFQSYYIAIPKLTRELLDKEEARYLLTVDFEDYLDYLESELKWDTQEWYPDRMTAEQFVAKVPRRDRFGNGQITVEVQCVRLRIPLAPHPQRKDYFKLGPFATWGSQPEFGFEGDILILEVEATEAAVQRGKEEVDFWLGNRNKDIESGNRELRDEIKNVWETRRQQLQEGFGATDDLLKKLNLPLHQDPNAKVKPIEIKERQLRTVVKKPSKNVPTDPSLSRDDVNGLVDFIDQYLKQFEVSPKAYSDRDEEPLRDILVGMMNANYPGSTTGETFSKLGKTDISFRLDSGHVLICECKFWGGAVGYGLALDQLFSYLTWRHNYGVLIHFSKLKGMTRAISEASRAIVEHGSYTVETLSITTETRLSSRHIHPQDPDKTVEVFHLFIDMSY